MTGSVNALLLVIALLLPVPVSGPTAREVLAEWDAERSAAWAAGDVSGLRALYTQGSVAGQRDVAMLRRWLERDLVVAGLQMQVLSLREVVHTDDRMVLDVVDRVVGGSVGGVALPVDAPSARTLVLRRVDGEWRVSAVR